MLLNVKFSLSLRILGLNHYRFRYSCQAFAYITSRNSPFDPIHLFSRVLLNLYWFLHYNENHFFHTCLIIKYHLKFLWQFFQYMRLCISIQSCLILNTLICHFEYHILQQASFRYGSEFFTNNTSQFTQYSLLVIILILDHVVAFILSYEFCLEHWYILSRI